jgi:putative ABC transport system substrate-binding protein
LIQIQNIPLIAGLVLDTDELHQHANTTAVGLNFPANLHWLWLRRLLPDAQQIAVIYDPRHSSALFQSLQQQARTEGIILIQASVSSAEDFPALLQNLPPQLDALWAVDGTVAYNPAAVRELLLYSFRNRVPLIGLSSQWVKAGALYALDWDYADLGRQAAELADAILKKGNSPASLSPVFPRSVRLVLNSKTAEHMKLQIADRWLMEMAEVFR